MQKVLIWLAILASVGFVGKIGFEKLFVDAELHSSEERVRRVLDGLKSGGNRQQAIGMWYRGSLNPPGGEQFEQAASGFERWCEAKKIGMTIANYEIKDAAITVPAQALAGAVVTVSGRIDGQPFTMRVQKDEPIIWIN
jgi:hypothetical protein